MITDNQRYWLYNEECLDCMSFLPSKSVDMIMADLPYGTTSCKWDSVIPLAPLWEQYRRICKLSAAMVFTASQPFTSALIMSNVEDFKQLQVWDKCMPVGFLNAKKKILLRHEDIVMFSQAPFGQFTYNPEMRTGKLRNKTPKRNMDSVEGRAYNTVVHKHDDFNDRYYPTSILELSNAHQTGKIHPTQKPVTLMAYLIKTYSNPGDVVLDNTMGSGTTGIACMETGRRFIGMEMDVDHGYFPKAVSRIQQAALTTDPMF